MINKHNVTILLTSSWVKQALVKTQALLFQNGLAELLINVGLDHLSRTYLALWRLMIISAREMISLSSSSSPDLTLHHFWCRREGALSLSILTNGGILSKHVHFELNHISQTSQRTHQSNQIRRQNTTSRASQPLRPPLASCPPQPVHTCGVAPVWPPLRSLRSPPRPQATGLGPRSRAPGPPRWTAEQ